MKVTQYGNFFLQKGCAMNKVSGNKVSGIAAHMA